MNEVTLKVLIREPIDDKPKIPTTVQKEQLNIEPEGEYQIKLENGSSVGVNKNYLQYLKGNLNLASTNGSLDDNTQVNCYGTPVRRDLYSSVLSEFGYLKSRSMTDEQSRAVLAEAYKPESFQDTDPKTQSFAQEIHTLVGIYYEGMTKSKQDTKSEDSPTS